MDKTIEKEIEDIILSYYHSDSEECAKSISSLIERLVLEARIDEQLTTYISPLMEGYLFDDANDRREKRIEQLQQQIKENK